MILVHCSRDNGRQVSTVKTRSVFHAAQVRADAEKRGESVTLSYVTKG